VRGGRYWAVASAAATLVLCAFAAPPALAEQTITSAGPITELTVGSDLSCQVSYGDPSFEFYPPNTSPGDCGTFLAAGGTLYAPDFAAHNTTATSGLGGDQIAFTPVSQTAVTGTGTTADPFAVETVARAGSVAEVRQRVTYVTGAASYRVDTRVTEQTGIAQSTRLFYAGDCYASGSDIGYGFTRPEIGAVGCSQNADNVPAARTIQYSPLSRGSSFLETRYRTVWETIGGSPFAAFPDTCACFESIDNGAGLSWNIGLGSGSTEERSLTVAFTESQPSAPPADSDGDAIPDAWETGNGPQSDDANLAPLGADPNRPDIFVHADWMAGCAPTPGWERQAVDMFARHGVALHIDSGPASKNADGTQWGGRSRAGEVPYTVQLPIQDSWAAFDALKDYHFVPANRRRAFHYVLFANRYSTHEYARGWNDGGVSRGTPDADVLAANCGRDYPAGEHVWSPRADAVVIAHELGHNLGLRHGGSDDIGYKPNYYSLMNYSWALHDAAGGTLTDFSTQRRPDLDERQLSERVGLQLPVAWWCVKKGQYIRHVEEGAGVRTDLDLDCDGKTGEGVGQVRYRQPGGIFGNWVSSVTKDLVSDNLVGFNDWEAIQYGGGGVLGALALPPRNDTPPEPDINSADIQDAAQSEDRGIQEQAKQLVVRISPKQLRRRRPVTVTVQVRVNGRRIRGAVVSIRGAKLARGSKRRTDRSGRLQLKLTARSRTEVTVTARRRGYFAGAVVGPVRRR
jgi:hypothetical protein